MTVAALAVHIRQASSRQLRWRLVREFLEEFKHEAAQSRQALLMESPPLTADARWDALLGAIAEHLAFHDTLRCPRWALDERRFLTTAWFLSDLPSVRAAAMETSPASFRRRAIFLERSDLDSA
ncbi:MAG: hypothetical protein H0W51_06610 [Euzebyales bacterium]|nr:hypothetical protein [Euzebyales bacterium]